MAAFNFRPVNLDGKENTQPTKAGSSATPKKVGQFNFKPVSASEVAIQAAAPKTPTLGGTIVRELAKIPVKAGLSIIAPFKGVDENGKPKGATYNSKYLGEVKDYLSTAGEKVDNLSNKVNAGEISKGRGVLGVLGAAAEPALDLGSFIPGIGIAKGIKEGAAVTAKAALKTSLIRGGAFGAGYDAAGQLASGEKFDPIQTLKAGAIGTALDFGISQAGQALSTKVPGAAAIKEAAEKKAPYKIPEAGTPPPGYQYRQTALTAPEQRLMLPAGEPVKPKPAIRLPDGKPAISAEPIIMPDPEIARSQAKIAETYGVKELPKPEAPTKLTTYVESFNSRDDFVKSLANASKEERAIFKEMTGIDKIPGKPQLESMWNRIHASPKPAKLLPLEPAAPRLKKQSVPTQTVERPAYNTNIPEKAPTTSMRLPTSTKGGTVSKASSDINARLVNEGFDALPAEEQARFNSVSREAQVKDIVEAMDQNIEAVKEAAVTGKTGKLDPQITFNAIKKHAKETGDIALQMKLAKSPIASQRSILAQKLGAAATLNDPGDAVEIMSNLNKQLETQVEKKLSVPVAQARKELIEQGEKHFVAETKKAVTKMSLTDFINSIETC